MVDSTDQALVAETSLTPRSARNAEKSAVQVGDLKPSATHFPLGSVLELTWLRVSNASLGVIEFRDQKAPLDLVLRCSAQASSAHVQIPPQSTRLSVPARAFARDLWELPTTDSAVRIALTPELLELLGNPGNHGFVLLQVSLAPRRSAARAWKVSFTLAVDAYILQQCGSDHAREVTTGLCDQDGGSVGVASVLLRWGQPSQLASPPQAVGKHELQPVVVRLSLAQLKRLVDTSSGSGTGLEVVVEASITGQEATRGFRSRPVKLLKAETDLSIENAATLTADDKHTQAIRLVVFRHSAKERAVRLAEAILSVSSLESSASQSTLIQLLSSATANDRSDAAHNVWGELTVKVSVALHGRTHSLNEPLSLAATSVLGGSAYTPELSDTGGTLEIELVEASIEYQLEERKDTEMTLGVKLCVPSSQWTAIATTATVSPAESGRAVRFKQQLFSTPVQWAAKERVIPTFSCSLSLTTADSLQDHKALKQSTLGAKTRSNGVDSGSAPSKVLQGSSSVQLPVVFIYPDEWMSVQLPVCLSNDDDLDSTCRLVQLRILMRLVADDSSGVDKLQAPRAKVSGHLALSRARASGVFLKGHRPNVAYAIRICSAGKRDQEKTLMVSASADEKSVTWTSTASCEVSRSDFAPVLIVDVFRVLHSSQHEMVAADCERGALVGTLSMTLPGDVLYQKHLVSFSLPLAAVATSGDREGPSPRKAGMLSFDLQFVDDSPPSASRHTSSVKLVVQRVQWTSTPPCLALSVSSGGSFVVQSSISIVGGQSLNEVLWSHDTTDIQATSDEGGGYVVDHSIRMSDATIAKLVATTASKSMLIVKLTSSKCGRNAERVVLGQAVVPIRGGWAAFAEQEQSKWHKLYEVSRRGSGNPEAIGEIQLSVVSNGNEEVDHRATDEERHESVDEWLYLEVVEAIWRHTDKPLVGGEKGKPNQAYVQLDQVGSARRPQKTKSQWSTNGVWHWNGDGVLTVPLAAKGDEGLPPHQVALVVDHDRYVQQDAIRLDLGDYIQRSRHGETVEDWLVSRDRNSHVRLRIACLPPVFGALRVTIRKIQSFQGSHANDISLQRIAWRCAVVSSALTATSEAKEGDVRSLQSLEGSQLVLSFDSSRREFGSQAIPTVKLQILGYAMGVQELCLGEALTPLPALLSSLIQSPETRCEEWITLHSRHDPAHRVAVMFVGFQFSNGQRQSSSVDSETFASPDDWREASAAVLTLWKKLFYFIDSDHNGRVDLNEFKELFISHREVFSQTQDGKMLLRVLFSQRQEGADFDAIERLFDEMDINGDKGIEWLEFVDYMQSKLLLVRPHAATQVAPGLAPERTNSEDIQGAPACELRRKRREDPHSVNGSSITTPSVSGSTAETSTKRHNVRQLSAANSRRSNANPGSTNGSSPRTETSHLKAKLESVQAMLDLEKQKSARLQHELRSLRLANHQLQMQRERDLLEEKTKTQYLTEAIRSHEQALKERDAVRAKHHTASIVLQSKVRMRLEQKRFHARRMLRWSAAVRIQCAYRCFVATKQLRNLQMVELSKRRRIASATKLQRFVRWHLRRKERLVHRQARALSVMLLQKCVRRWLAMRLKKRCVRATVTIQSWSRRRLAKRHVQRLREAYARVNHWLQGCVHRRRWCRLRAHVGRVQQWWRRANEMRWEYVTQLEAAMCIQAVWRGHQNRHKLRQLLMSRRERGREEAQSDLMAAAMGVDEETTEDAEKKVIGREEIEGHASGEKVAFTGHDETRQSEEDPDEDDFGAQDGGGDESTPPLDQSLDQNTEEVESIEPETKPTTTAIDPELKGTCDETPTSNTVTALETDDGIRALSDGPSASVEALESTVSLCRIVEPVDEGSTESQVAEVLQSLVEVVLHVTANGHFESFDDHSSSSEAPKASARILLVESEEDTSGYENTEDIESGGQANVDAGMQDEIKQLVEELVGAVDGQQILIYDCSEKVEVEAVLHDLVDAVAECAAPVAISEESGHAASKVECVNNHSENRLGMAEDLCQLADEVGTRTADAETKPSSEATPSVAHEDRQVEEGICAKGENGDGSEPPTPTDLVESSDADAAHAEDVVIASAPVDANKEALDEETVTKIQADPMAGTPSEVAVEDGVLAEIAEIDTDETRAQAEEEATVSPTTIEPGVSAEVVEVRDDEAVTAASVESDGGTTPEAETATTILTAFDVSESEDEGERSRDLESSGESDDLQLMADADAVNHIQDAEMSDDGPLDGQDSRQSSKRADSEQQMLLDLDELTQPAAAMAEGLLETNNGDQVVVADLD